MIKFAIVVELTPPLLPWVSGPAASRNSNLTAPHRYQLNHNEQCYGAVRQE
jgi:hypothetical protein